MDIEQNIEILWYIFTFLPQGYGALLRLVSKSYKYAVDNVYKPIYTELISEYGLNPNLIEQFRLGYTIDMCFQSKSKWLKLLHWSRKYYHDTDILLLYACSIENSTLINSICNVSQIPPLNLNICLDLAFKNSNMIIIKRLYESVEELTVEHLLWLCIIHKQEEVFNWLCKKNLEKICETSFIELKTFSTILFLPAEEILPEYFLHVSWQYLPVITENKEDFEAQLLIYAKNKAKPFAYDN